MKVSRAELKRKYQELSEKYLKHYKKVLKLSRWKIDIKVIDKKEAKKEMPGYKQKDAEYLTDCYGITFIEKEQKAAKIFIRFDYNMDVTGDTLKDTVLHELIHIFLVPITKNMPSLDCCEHDEENLVCLMTKLLSASLPSPKLEPR